MSPEEIEIIWIVLWFILVVTIAGYMGSINMPINSTILIAVITILAGFVFIGRRELCLTY